MQDLALEIRNVSHAYGERRALVDVSLDLPRGTLLALLGPNGSGKTTLFRVISTLLEPSSGRVKVCGRDVVKEADSVRARIGVVFQHNALDRGLTVAENLRHHAALYGIRGSRLRERMREVLEAAGLFGRANERIGTLSGGLARRADLARVLVHHPDVLLLDEPTSGLDPAARREFWRIVGLMRRSSGMTVLVATHLLDEAEHCDDLAILSEGRLVVRGTPSALKADLGEETLWIESDAAQNLARSIDARFGVNAQHVGGMLQISHRRAHALLGQIYEAFPGEITSATVRRPTLEDVYLIHTGHGMDSPFHSLEAMRIDGATHLGG